ncbi:MAG: DUF1570 domain-containing protein [Isosphaeraceae bacterium]
MQEQTRVAVGSDRLVDRRFLLKGALAAWAGGSCRAGEPDSSQSQEDQERREVEAIAAKARLRAFATTRSAHYLGTGDTSDALRSQALRDCEAVAADYLAHFQSHGFKVAMPATRLTVVILTDDRSRGAFNVGIGVRGIPIEMTQLLIPAGHYEPQTNRAILGLHARANKRAERLDLRLLAHEVTHQLTFNTGLLDRRGDVPRSIAEGFAEYGAVRKTGRQIAPGYPHESVITLMTARRSHTPWYPVAQLLADDRPFLLGCFKRLQSLAYAQAWLLIHYLMIDRSRSEGFRAYLEAIRPRTDQEHRLDDAEKHLGDLDRLDKDLLAYFVRLNMSA